MNKYFIDFDLSNFWSNNEYTKNYQSAPVIYNLIEVVEKELGFRLPQSYILTFPVKSLLQAANPHRGRVILTNLATVPGYQ